jgi:hypothetical protein
MAVFYFKVYQKKKFNQIRLMFRDIEGLKARSHCFENGFTLL